MTSPNFIARALDARNLHNAITKSDAKVYVQCLPSTLTLTPCYASEFNITQPSVQWKPLHALFISHQMRICVRSFMARRSVQIALVGCLVVELGRPHSAGW